MRTKMENHLVKLNTLLLVFLVIALGLFVFGCESTRQHETNPEDKFVARLDAIEPQYDRFGDNEGYLVYLSNNQTYWLGGDDEESIRLAPTVHQGSRYTWTRTDGWLRSHVYPGELVPDEQETVSQL